MCTYDVFYKEFRSIISDIEKEKKGEMTDFWLIWHRNACP